MIKKIMYTGALFFLGFGAVAQQEMSEDEAFKEFLKKQKGVKFKEDVEKEEAEKAKVLQSSTAPAPEVAKPTTAPPPKPEEVKKTEPPVKAAEKKEPAKPTAAANENKSTAPAPPEKKESAKPTVVSPPVTKEATPVHTFKEINATYSLEGERKGGEMLLFIKLDNIDQYEKILIERGSSESGYNACKTIPVKPGEYKNGIIETSDKYPLSSRTDSYYRIKAVTTNGSVKVFPHTVIPAGVK